MLGVIIRNKQEQGYVVDGLRETLDGPPDSYDAMAEFGRRLRELPLRSDWPYVEPNELDEILTECDPERPRELDGHPAPEEAADRAAEAFLGLVCGCILGKPVEVAPMPLEIRRAAQEVGEWPITDYISERMLDALGRRHPSWPSTTRGRISHVAPDDDINYPIIAMLVLERHGFGFAGRTRAKRSRRDSETPVRVTSSRRSGAS